MRMLNPFNNEVAPVDWLEIRSWYDIYSSKRIKMNMIFYLRYLMPKIMYTISHLELTMLFEQ